MPVMYRLPSTVARPPIVVIVKRGTVPQQPSAAYGYDEVLNAYRNKIDNITPDVWKKVRWYINDFDFLVKDPIINRAFYKYWEIINEFDLFEQYSSEDVVLHCAEAPGGFIQGTNIYLQINEGASTACKQPASPNMDEDGFTVVKSRRKPRRNPYKIFTISLNKDLPQYKTYNLPSYNKSILNKHVCVTYGKDNSGDINNIDNIEYISTLCPNPFYLITSDGGFDEGNDFNHKEQLHYRLILHEVFAGIRLQKQGGHFVLKMFDMFTTTSVHVLYLLSLLYRDVFVYKPQTSRPTNSERYIICKHFTCDEAYLNSILHELRKLSSQLHAPKYVSFTLFETIPDGFVSTVQEMNADLIAKQCAFLDKAIKLCNEPTFVDNYENELGKLIEQRRSVFRQWESSYNLDSFI